MLFFITTTLRHIIKFLYIVLQLQFLKFPLVSSLTNNDENQEDNSSWLEKNMKIHNSQTLEITQDMIYIISGSAGGVVVIVVIIIIVCCCCCKKKEDAKEAEIELQNQQNIKMGLKKQEDLKQQGQYNMEYNNNHMSPRKQ